MQFALKDVITISIAAVGAVLGIINTWNSINQRRVRLRVVPKHAFFGNIGSAAGEMVCIEVVNLSAFAVGLCEIGFTISGDPKKAQRISIMAPLTADHKPIARTLQSRQSVTGYFEANCLHPGIKKAYARTDCGVMVIGNSPALKSIRKLAGG
jgi:hypothetical protein